MAAIEHNRSSGAPPHRVADPRVADLNAPFAAAVMVGDGRVVLTVAGEIDLATHKRLRASVEHAVDSVLAVGAESLVVDVAAVRFLDAGGVAVLTAGAERLHMWGARLTLRGVTAHVAWLLDITGASRSLGLSLPSVDRPVETALTEAATVPAVRAVLDSALRLVVTMAQAVVAGADGVSITLPRQGRFGTVAASNAVVRGMDQDQYSTGEGPCLDAATQAQRFHIGALADETRWPRFVPLARARGIKAILSTPLVHAAKPIGALNIYSRTADAFAANEQAWADEFAAEAAQVVHAARRGTAALGRHVQDDTRASETAPA